MAKDTETHKLQPDPPEGSRDVIDRELTRMEQKQEGQTKPSAGDAQRQGGGKNESKGS